MANYFRNFELTPIRAKYIRAFGLVALISVLGASALFVAHEHVIALFVLAGSLLCLITAAEIRFHGSMLTLALIFSPFIFALFGVYRSREIWTKWEFWAYTVCCELLSAVLLIWIGQDPPIYVVRKLPNQSTDPTLASGTPGAGRGPVEK